MPTIVEELGDGNNYSWVGRSVRGPLPILLALTRHNYSAYLLAAATLSPLYGKLSDLIGQLVPPNDYCPVAHAACRPQTHFVLFHPDLSGKLSYQISSRFELTFA